MNVTVQAGTISGDALQRWLGANVEPSLQRWLEQHGQGSAHALIEYVHRFAFVDWENFLQDLRKSEIAEFSLQGRLFWETGQLRWRRLDASRCSLCLILEDTSLPPLPEELRMVGPIPEAITHFEDSCLLLWGTYNKDDDGFLEQRVAGSRLLVYPQAITASAKAYPILEVRTYFSDEGEPVVWRFVRPGARDLKDWSLLVEEDV